MRLTPDRNALVTNVERWGSSECATPTNVAMVANSSEQAIISATPRVLPSAPGAVLGAGEAVNGVGKVTGGG